MLRRWYGCDPWRWSLHQWQYHLEAIEYIGAIEGGTKESLNTARAKRIRKLTRKHHHG